MRCNPLPMHSASLTASALQHGLSTAHWQKVAMSAARSEEILDSANPDSMIGIRAAAALRRLISGVERGNFLDMSLV